MKSNKKEKKQSKIERQQEQEWLTYVKKHVKDIDTIDLFIESVMRMGNQRAIFL
jgi:hypothetical protein